MSDDVYNCIHTGTEYKSVRLTVDAYETLERRKRAGESFSETVRRLARERPIADVAGVFTDDEVAAVREAREASYVAYTDSRNGDA